MTQSSASACITALVLALAPAPVRAAASGSTAPDSAAPPAAAPAAPHAGGLADSTSIAFFYGREAPLDELKAFDIAVVDPDHGFDPKAYATGSQSELFAYVALGEVEDSRPWRARMPDNWFLGRNPRWRSQVVDQTRQEWQEFFVDQVLLPIWNAGYRGFFFDAVDSYHLFADSGRGGAAQARALAALVRRAHARFPEARIILNRGFEILPEIHDIVHAVAFESLHQGWDPALRLYRPVPEKDRKWLLARAGEAKSQWGLPVIAIDYVDPGNRPLARATADSIRKAGFIPWVSDAAQTQLGVGAVEVFPRKVLVLYHGAETHCLRESQPHLYIEMVLNQLGFSTEYRDIQQPLPAYPLSGRYAGVVLWTMNLNPFPQLELNQWLARQIGDGVKLAIFDDFGFPLENRYLAPFGVRTGRDSDSLPGLKIEKIDRSVVGFEDMPLPDRRMFAPIRANQGEVLLRIANDLGDTMDAAAIMPWGGYALNPYVVQPLPNSSQLWVLHPMEFVRRAFRVGPWPAPDVTTENGSRLLMIHIDGDGFPSRAEWPGGPYAGEVIEKQILSTYPFVSTVSVIEGEISPEGLYPEKSAELEAIARRIFALSNVEPATHTYSHPFFWNKDPHGKPNNLPLKDYAYSLDKSRREIVGSVSYINERLAPQGKQCRVVLWSGDCDPAESNLATAASHGFHSMNGGETVISRSNRSWTAISALGVWKGRYFQVYAPNQNENMYTNLWTGPFYGFRRVIETFEKTDRPIRFKPVDIYYHMYSGSKIASLSALRTVYDWAMGQNLFNVYASEYIEKVHDFNATVVARRGEAWIVRNAAHLRTVRIPREAGWPDLRTSRGVLGWRDHETERYIHLADGGDASIVLRKTPPREAFLSRSNGSVSRLRRVGRGLSFVMDGHLPLSFDLGNAKDCNVHVNSRSVSGQRQDDGTSRHILKEYAAQEIRVSCPE